MYCQRCGNEIQNNDAFCRKCGNRIINQNNIRQQQINTNSVTYNREISNNNCNQNMQTNFVNYKSEYKFKKDKWIGSILIAANYSDVNIVNGTIYIQQYKKYIDLIKGSTKNKQIQVSSIQNAIIEKKVDVVDLIYAIVFCFFGILAIPATIPILLFGLLCLWTGYGERIKLIGKSGEKIIIHAEISQESQKFLNEIYLNNGIKKENWNYVQNNINQ